MSEIEQRIERLEDDNLALSVVLVDLVRFGHPLENRKVLRERACNAVEALYSGQLRPGGYERTQRVLDAIERLFQAAGA